MASRLNYSKPLITCSLHNFYFLKIFFIDIYKWRNIVIRGCDWRINLQKMIQNFWFTLIYAEAISLCIVPLLNLLLLF